jgi:hypothetical protein
MTELTTLALFHFNVHQVVGRKAPTETEPSPPAYRMKLFAPNAAIAKSRFWYFMHSVSCGSLKRRRAAGVCSV